MNKPKTLDELSNNGTRIIHRNEIRGTKYDWGDNGIGNRFAKKQYNYGVIYFNKKTKVYSENDDDIIPNDLLIEFFKNNKFINLSSNKVIGIYIFSKKNQGTETRPIRPDIKKYMYNNSCVVCGCTSEIVCDHKNDLYNDFRVLNIKTQTLEDFQSLCNHCNLQKRQICRDESNENKIYSAKRIITYKKYPFEFPWEKKCYDKNDINCKRDTFWYDPIEFNIKIIWYYPMTFVLKEFKLIFKPFEPQPFNFDDSIDSIINDFKLLNI